MELDYTKVTDAGLASLRGLTQLGVLTLTGTSDRRRLAAAHEPNTPQIVSALPSITDAGLENLKGLPLLTEVSLYNTQITDAGVKKLHQACQCKIERSHG